MKLSVSILVGAAMVLAPVTAEARNGGGRAGGGAHSVARGSSSGHAVRAGYNGGYHYGGYGWRGWPYFYGPALGLYLGFYSDPWFWGYPGYSYYGYPAYPVPAYAPPVVPYPGADSPAPSAAPQAQSVPQTCGSWQWNAAEKQYHWVTNGCS